MARHLEAVSLGAVDVAVQFTGHEGALALKVALHTSRVSKIWFELSLFRDAATGRFRVFT